MGPYHRKRVQCYGHMGIFSITANRKYNFSAHALTKLKC